MQHAPHRHQGPGAPVKRLHGGLSQTTCSATSRHWCKTGLNGFAGHHRQSGAHPSSDPPPYYLWIGSPLTAYPLRQSLSASAAPTVAASSHLQGSFRKQPANPYLYPLSAPPLGCIPHVTQRFAGI